MTKIKTGLILEIPDTRDAELLKQLLPKSVRVNGSNDLE